MWQSERFACHRIVCPLPPHTRPRAKAVVAESEQGRGILGVVDGFRSKGIEDEGETKWRKGFLRKIGYKL
jgi:adenosine/AMP kinase